MVSGRTVGSSPLFAIASLACLVLVIVAGCATTQETPQQSYVWQMGRICDARSPFWRMERVEADGRYVVQGATNAPPGRNDYVACMQEQFTKTPYREWLSQRATALESAPVAPSSSGSVTSSTATTTQSPLATTSVGASLERALKPTWTDSPTNVSPWDAITKECDNVSDATPPAGTTGARVHVWCVQD